MAHWDNRKWTVSGQGKRRGSGVFEYFSFEVEMTGGDAMYYKSNRPVLESLVKMRCPHFEKVESLDIG